MNHRSERLHLAFALIAVLALLGALFLYVIGIDALEGRSEFQFFADSQTYHEAARGGFDQIESWTDMVGVAANFLGPLVLLRIAGENYYAVLVLNACLLAFGVTSLSRSLNLHPTKFLLVLLLNPMTISSLLSVNKEIISLIFVAFLVRAYAAHSLWALMLAAITSLLVRWQQTMVLVVAVALLGAANPFRERRLTTLFALLVLLSILYLAFAQTLAPLRLILEDSSPDYDGSGLFEQLVKLQDAGWYWAIFPLKAAHLLFAMGLRFDRLLSPVDWYNDFWQLLHSTSLLVLFLALVRARRFSVHNDLVYLSLIYIAVFAVTPIYTPRYFFPIYVLWAAALCIPQGTTHLLKQPFGKPMGRQKRSARAEGRSAFPQIGSTS